MEVVLCKTLKQRTANGDKWGRLLDCGVGNQSGQWSAACHSFNIEQDSAADRILLHAYSCILYVKLVPTMLQSKYLIPERMAIIIVQPI
jgi:hypothetical protein